MTTNKRLLTKLLNKQHNLARLIFRACADGRVKELHKLKKQFKQTCDEYLANK